MRSPLLWAAAIAALLAGGAFALSGDRTVAAPPDRTGPATSNPTATATPPTTRLLTVQIDAHGVTILQATRKPSLGFRLRKDWERLPFRWSLRTAAGDELARGGFDPGRIDLDPTRAGLPARVEGDRILPTAAHTNVRVPDLSDAARIEFARMVDGRALPFGTVDLSTVPVR